MKFINFISFCKKINIGHLLFVGVLMSILIPFCNNSLGEVDYLFMDLDKSLRKSAIITDSANQELYLAIEEEVELYKNVVNLSYLKETKKVRYFSAVFSKKIDSLYTELSSQCGGLDVHQKPRLFKDKNIAFTYFSQNQRAEWLIREIQNTRDSMLACIRDERDRVEIEGNISLHYDTSQHDFLQEKFKNYSVASVLSMLSLLKSHAKVSETAVLNYVAQKVSSRGFCCFACGMLIPGIAPKQSSAILGENFKADITFSRFMDTPNATSKMAINGKSVKVKKGVASFSQKETSLGTKKMSVDAVVFAKYKTGRFKYVFDTSYVHRDFYYEVVAPMAFLHSKTNQNLYVGVAHSVDIHIAEENDENIVLKSNDLIINKIKDGKYTIQANKIGKTTLRVDGNAFGQTFYFNVKKIPTPIAKLAQQTEGMTITKENWQLQKSLSAEIKDFDFEADCKIERFVFTYIPAREDAIVIENTSEVFNSQIIDIQKIAKQKDHIHFTDIKAKCQGDTEARLLNTMIFEIR